MAGKKSEPGNPVSPCITQQKKDVPVSKTRNISIKCKHRNCPSGAFIKEFEVVPDVKTFSVDETITINWTGNDPKPPPQLECGTGQVISGPPYTVPVSFFNDATVENKIFPEIYKKLSDTNATKVDLTKTLLKQIFTFSYKGRITIADFPWGTFDVIVHNPDQWKVEIELPFSGKSSYKKGTKWDKELNKDGARIKTKTYEKKSDGQEVSEKDVERNRQVENYSMQSRSVTHTEKDKDGTSELKDVSGSIQNNQTGSTFSGQNITLKIDGPESDNQVIKIEKNSTLLDINGIKIISFVAKALKLVKKFQDVLKDIPKAGAYFDCEATVLDGKITLEWGWKEYTDHRAYMKIKANIKIVFFDLKLEIGVGISGFSVKFQAFVSLQGTFEFSGNIERDKPFSEETIQNQSMTKAQKGKELLFENSVKVKTDLTASIIGTVGARFEALYFVKIEPKIESGLKGEGVIEFFTTHNLAEIQTSVKFTGIKAKVETSFGFSDALGNEKSSGKKKGMMDPLKDKTGIDPELSSKHQTEEPGETVLMDEYTFWRSRFPDDLSHYSDHDDILDDDFKSVISEMINGRYINSGWFSSYKVRVMKQKTSYDEYSVWQKVKANTLGSEAYEDVPDEEVRDILFTTIDKQRKLDRSKDSVDLLMLEIRNNLSAMMKDKGYIDHTDLVQFANHKLKNILHGYLDQSKIFLSKHKRK